jgi:hypothetical protein
MGLDTITHTLYLPGAGFETASGISRPPVKPDPFMVLAVNR